MGIRVRSADRPREGKGREGCAVRGRGAVRGRRSRGAGEVWDGGGVKEVMGWGRGEAGLNVDDGIEMTGCQCTREGQGTVATWAEKPGGR